MKDKKKDKKHRFLIILMFLGLIFFSLIGRLFYIMVTTSDKYRARAYEQQKSEIQINAKRGRILDRSNNELAISVNVYQVDLDLITLKLTLSQKKMTFDDLADKLVPIVNMKKEDIVKILNTTLPNGLPASSAILKRQVEQSEVDKIKALNIRGIVIASDTKRYYTNNNFLSVVLGRLNYDGKGISGVELAYDKELLGTPGSISYEKDVKNNQLPYEDQQYVKPVDGKDIVLTIDETIEDYIEKAAEKALNDNKAKAVNIIVMNPKNGEILAMTSKAAQNQDSSKDVNSLWKNPSVQDTFEPGSIFKVVTAAAALEYNIGVNDGYVCGGYSKIGGTTIRCWDENGHGNESFSDIIKNSCNVGFMQLGGKLGKDKLIAFSQKMGFGQKTGIDLPGESPGILRKPSQINAVDLATIAFGQGLGVTQVQYMAAFNTIANGGTWIKPHIMKNIVHADESGKIIVDKNFSDYNNKKVFDTGLSATLRSDLEKVVTEGVGKNAFVDGLNVGGKTGTAQVIDPATGRYAEGKYMSSFAGMAPVSDPKVTLLVSVDEPSSGSYYAGDVSAPVARDLFKQIFNYITIKGEENVLGK